MAVGVIINPRSGRASGKGQALATAVLARGVAPDAVTVLEDFSQLQPALRRYAAEGVQRLFISSGDGTVQAIQTFLAESGHFPQLPQVCLLPHGTTNMTAADLGFRHRSIDAQADFIARGTVNSVSSRHSVKVENPKSGGPLHGMFFGTGAVSEAALFCQRTFNDRGVAGSWATFATLASAVATSLLKAPNPHDPNRLDRPFHMKVEAGNQVISEGMQLMMLVTTLNKLILGSKPFWGGATAPLRTTVVPYPLPSIPRWLIPTLYGNEERKGPPGAISKAVAACSVTCPASFVIDGEFHLPPDDAPLRLSAGPQFQFITA